MADTRPSNSGGVTDWRNVVVLMIQRIGPAPSRKKPNAASIGLATTIVDMIASEPAKPKIGPIATTAPNGTAAMTRGASIAPTTMPKPNMPRMIPTAEGDRRRW